MQQMKHNLLHRYLHLFCQHLSPPLSPLYDDQNHRHNHNHSQELNLSHCLLDDTDIDLLIDWLRNTNSNTNNSYSNSNKTVPAYNYLQRLSLQNNQLTSSAIFKLLVWVCSWSFDDVSDRISAQRPLHINLQSNFIHKKELTNIVDYILTNNPDIAHITGATASSADSDAVHSRYPSHNNLYYEKSTDHTLTVYMKISSFLHDHVLSPHTLSTGEAQGLKDVAKTIVIDFNKQKCKSPYEEQMIKKEVSFCDPIVSKIQPYSSAILYPSKALENNVDVLHVDNDQLVPRDLILKHDFIL
jgi:hypothetical protein